ncbi:protein tipE [Schistocerca nitens]|uniref:protein tipE n=1 Tax=Schistocerca nitens TaxID=7011 RepID=UPI002118328D|nr:protein tipE [Schistocerca nitens]
MERVRHAQLGALGRRRRGSAVVGQLGWRAGAMRSRGSSELLLGELAGRTRRTLALPLAGPSLPPTTRTCRQHIWWYGTWVLSTALVFSGCALLFLVPLYVDPAISTLAADFYPFPVECVTVRREDLTGLYNCTWSSCREGCTSDVYSCTHLYVNYKRPLYEYKGENESEAAAVLAAGPVVCEREAVLLVNIKGCGYPPEVVCDNFTASYGTEGATYPCYFSRVNKSQVIPLYEREHHVSIIINYLAIPLIITIASSLVLCAMHCDCSATERLRRLKSRATMRDFSECHRSPSNAGMLSSHP